MIVAALFWCAVAGTLGLAAALVWLGAPHEIERAREMVARSRPANVNLPRRDSLSIAVRVWVKAAWLIVVAVASMLLILAERVMPWLG